MRPAWHTLKCLSCLEAGKQLSRRQREAVTGALREARARLAAEFNGMWCDALPALIHLVRFYFRPPFS